MSPAVVPPPSEGEVQAMVFADLEAKKELVQIVIERKVPAARVKELTEQWRELKSLVVDVPGNAPALAQLQEALAQATSKIAELRARGDALLKYLRSLPKLPQSRSRCPTCRSRGSLAVPLTCTVCNTTIQRQAPPAEEQQAPPSGG